MSRDDFLRIARARGLVGDRRECYVNDVIDLLNFAQLVAAQAAAEEREACAEICDVPFDVDDWEVQCGAEGRQLCNDLARAIRARGTA